MLRCEECGEEANYGGGGARLARIPNRDRRGEPEEVVVYCPDCARWKFEDDDD
jgi:hypothetical protein